MLDRQTAVLLQKLVPDVQGAGATKQAFDVADARDGVAAVFAEFSGAEKTNCVVTEVCIPREAGEIPARLYRPNAPRKGPAPLIVFFHGGGWSLGDLDCYDELMRALCTRSDAIFLSIDYRLAPEHKFPAGLNDCIAAVEWAALYANSIGADPEHLAVMGDSAGGNLTAAVAHRVHVAGRIKLAAQFLLYPILDISQPHSAYASRIKFGDGAYYLSCAGIDATVDWYLNGASLRENPNLSPILANNIDKLPPTVIIAAGCFRLLLLCNHNKKGFMKNPHSWSNRVIHVSALSNSQKLPVLTLPCDCPRL
ncbi:MAG: alpha/beta hydrolase [Alphaproteobacteria bacterium]|nr:alpha/beta hydrolase [Alphaproteobacteria bacterium]